MMIIKINYYFQEKEKSYNKRLDKIEELSNKIDYNDLKYAVVNNRTSYNFSELEDPLTFLNDI